MSFAPLVLADDGCSGSLAGGLSSCCRRSGLSDGTRVLPLGPADASVVADRTLQRRSG